jgi:predicted transposase/invertase (TIGR01784 family)
MALSILCDFEGKDKQLVVNTILKRLKELTNGDELEYKNYLKKVNILSTNRDLEKEVEKGAKMLSVDIEKTPFYQMGMREGINKGIQEGIKEGIQEGILKGVEKVALSMLKINVDINIIQTTTGLSLEEIEKLKSKIDK